MTDWDVIVQFTLHCDLSISSGNAIINLNGISPCYSRCRWTPPAGEDDGVGVFCKNGGVRGRRNNKQPSFSPLMFVISAFGGNDEQLSEAGIQDKYASGVAGHDRRLRRRNNAASKRLCHATRDDISIAGSPPAGEDDGVGVFCKNGGVRGRRAGHNRRLRRRNNAASKRLCHATRDDISIAGFPPTGEDDGLGVFCKNGGVRGRRAGHYRRLRRRNNAAFAAVVSRYA